MTKSKNYQNQILPNNIIDKNKIDFNSSVDINEILTIIEMATIGTLIICICNPPILRDKILKYIQEKLDKKNKIVNIKINKKDVNLINILKNKINKINKNKRINEKIIVSIMNVESIALGDELDASYFYKNINIFRDFFINIKNPILFWVSDAVLSNIIIKSPDFWRARTKVVRFGSKIDMLYETTKQLSSFSYYVKDYDDLKRREMLIYRLLETLNKDKISNRDIYLDTLLYLAQIKFKLNELLEVEKIIDKCIEINRDIKDENILSECYYFLGILNERKILYDKARKYYNDSLKISKKLNNREGIAKNLYQIAMIETSNENYQKAKNLCNDALNIILEDNEMYGISKCNSLLGYIAFMNNNYDEAKKIFLNNLEIEKSIGYTYGVIYSLYFLGLIEKEIGNYEKAKILLKDSLKISTKMHDKYKILQNTYLLGEIEYDLKNYNYSIKFLEKSIELGKELGSNILLINSLIILGNIFFEQNKNLEGIEKYLLFIQYAQELDILKEESINNLLQLINNAIRNLNSIEKKLISERIPKNILDKINL